MNRMFVDPGYIFLENRKSGWEYSRKKDKGKVEPAKSEGFLPMTYDPRPMTCFTRR